MKKLKFILLALMIVSCILIIAACSINPGGGGGNNPSGGTGGGSGIPRGTYTIISTAYVAPVYSAGCPAQLVLDSDTSNSQPCNDAKIILDANNDISFYAVGSFIIGFQGGTNSGVGGSANAISYVADNGGYKCIKVNAANGGILGTINKAGFNINVSCTFTYASNVITATMKYELTSNSAHFWTQTFEFAKI